MTVTGGLGGILVPAMAAAFLLHLLLRKRGKAGMPGRPDTDRVSRAVIYVPSMALWLATCFYMITYGERFIEHAAAPAGILAGCMAGTWLAVLAPVSALMALFCVLGAFGVSRDLRPVASDATEKAMLQLAKEAETEDAVIASWWDMGYYYAYTSGHPVLWDGGSQDSLRALLVARALVTEDLAESSAIFRMLAGTGNQAALKLAEKLGMQEGLQALWALAPLGPEEAETALEGQYGFDGEEAETIGRLIHPPKGRETYLVISGRMLEVLGWIEYYAGWDFTGKAQIPVSVAYNILPDGTDNMGTEDPAGRTFFDHRKRETVWRLFFGRDAVCDGTALFDEVCRYVDETDQVQVWKIRQSDQGQL